MNNKDNSVKTNFINKINDQASIFSNLSTILEKIMKDGYIDILFEAFERIFNKEIEFALKEINDFKMNLESYSIKQLLGTNITIFKENFKIIFNQAVDQYWNSIKESSKIDNLIKKKNFPFEVEVIKELDEENFYSEKFSKNSFEKYNDISDILEINDKNNTKTIKNYTDTIEEVEIKNIKIEEYKTKSSEKNLLLNNKEFLEIDKNNFKKKKKKNKRKNSKNFHLKSQVPEITSKDFKKFFKNIRKKNKDIKKINEKILKLDVKTSQKSYRFNKINFSSGLTNKSNSFSRQSYNKSKDKIISNSSNSNIKKISSLKISSINLEKKSSYLKNYKKKYSFY